MSKIILIFIGIWMIVVGSKGNALKVLDVLETEIKPFAVWIVAILILSAAYSQPRFRPIVGALVTLMIIAMVVRNKEAFNNIMGTFNDFYGLSQGKSFCSTNSNITGK